MTLGEKIFACRKGAGLSQEALAERLNVSRQAVSKWETGDAEPESGKLGQLARVFGVTVDWLLTGQGQPEEVPGSSAPKGKPVRAAGKCLGWLLAAALLLGLMVTVTHIGRSWWVELGTLSRFWDPLALLFLLAAVALTLAGAGSGRDFCKAVVHRLHPDRAGREELPRYLRALRCGAWAAALESLLYTAVRLGQLLAATDLSRTGTGAQTVLCVWVYGLLFLLGTLPLYGFWRNRET